MATTYTVTSDRLHIEKDGKRKTYYRGQSISGLSAEQADRFKSLGAIGTSAGDEAKAAKAAAEAGTTGPNPGEVSDPAAASTPAPTGITQPQASEIVAAQNSAPPIPRPANAASTDAWREYAVMSGQLTNEEAAKQSRDKLRDTLK